MNSERGRPCQSQSGAAQPPPDDRIQRAYRVRIPLFLLCSVLGIAMLFLASQYIVELVRLPDVEHERDQWQRADEVIRALNLRSGDVVSELGCGSGYFTLKISPVVGTRGKVLAVDIRRMPLLALRLRASMRNLHNIEVIKGQPDDPLLETDAVNAVLIANAYHELTHPNVILDKVKRSLRRGGRLVVVDRSPSGTEKRSREAETQQHMLSISFAEAEILQSGFEVVSLQDRFIERPGHNPWWLLVARKP
jgi:ubiquinone/menaquinone biosynthesis C-methylase UbiE